MAKPPTKTSNRSKQSLKTKKTRDKPKSIGRLLLILLSLVGVSVMAYLTKLHFKESDGGSFCDINAKLSCGAVNTSEYSEILGIPVSVMGGLYFLAVLFLAVFQYNQETLKKLIFVSLAFLGPSLYLTGLEIWVIDSICLFCELSKVLMLLIALLSIWLLKPFKGANIKELVTNGVVVAVILGAGAFLTHRVTIQQVPEGKYNEFAQQLSEESWVMYGSVTCQFCERQRAAFGEEAFSYINEIECDPRNENDQAELCVAKEVDHTPTWIQEDAEGNTLQKLEAGMYPLNELSDLTGVPLTVTEE